MDSRRLHWNSSGYTITVADSNLYTFSASSGTATTGGQRGEGECDPGR